MTTPEQLPVRCQSRFRRGLRWCLSWRGLRSVLIALAWLVTLLALFYVEENWRGRRAWNKYRRELEARGEQWDLKAFIPRPVLAEENFAATPFVTALFHNRDPFVDNFGPAFMAVAEPEDGELKRHRHALDLVAWQQAFAGVRAGDTNKLRSKLKQQDRDLETRAKAAPAVLAEFKTDEAIFAELMAACRRPGVRYPVNYNVMEPFAILLPYISGIKNTCLRLQVKACAELALGQNEPAFQDVQLALNLADSLKGEITLVTYLLRVACLEIAVQPVWEGLAEHRWSEAQLIVMQTRFSGYNLIADCQPALASDRACGLAMVDYLQRSGKLGEFTRNSNDTLPWEILTRLFVLMPAGWYDLERLNYWQLFDEQFEGASEPAAKRVFPRKVEANIQRLDERLSARGVRCLLQHRLTANLFLPALGRAFIRASVAQTLANEVALACALERYRLANGQFPDRLEALVPQFMSELPKDVIAKGDYHYRRTDNGRFMLYSIGWDEQDDGGKPGKVQFDSKSGDWAWD